MNFQEATRGMTRRQKLGYLWDYYKLPILLAAAALCLILSVTVHALTRKNVCLSMAFVNVQVSDETLQEMTAPYLDTQPGGPSRNTRWNGLCSPMPETHPPHQKRTVSRMNTPMPLR